MSKVTVEQWKEMFRQIGLTESDMDKWHQVFEQTNPQGHQDFLESLDLSRDEIKEIREVSSVAEEE